MRYLSWLVTLPVALLAVSFAVSNLEPVSLGLWPLPFRVEAPAFTLVLVTLVLGFLQGALVAWLGQHGHRKAERQHQARADRLQRELDTLKAQPAVPPAPAAPARAMVTSAPRS
ncbi:DUF1049 domain-containing protein [Aerophototrophica crusticola]|uniref:DUF1049 domain-containing protein n=1 Tax=Aerophototrophica crusticola TaxID=1709002 RepID=A0A858RBE0_9PROT|nr:DUF1049 domain-containing protein [Rhodospirillaceae bacterium B3]